MTRQGKPSRYPDKSRARQKAIEQNNRRSAADIFHDTSSRLGSTISTPTIFSHRKKQRRFPIIGIKQRPRLKCCLQPHPAGECIMICSQCTLVCLLISSAFQQLDQRGTSEAPTTTDHWRALEGNMRPNISHPSHNRPGNNASPQQATTQAK